MTPAGSQWAYSITAWKMTVAWTAYAHPQKASFSFSEAPQPLSATGLCVGAETSHRREQQGLQGMPLPSPVLEAERFNQVLSTELRAPTSNDGEWVSLWSLGVSHRGFPSSDHTLQGYRCICWTLQIAAQTPCRVLTLGLTAAHTKAMVSLMVSWFLIPVFFGWDTSWTERFQMTRNLSSLNCPTG